VVSYGTFPSSYLPYFSFPPSSFPLEVGPLRGWRSAVSSPAGSGADPFSVKSSCSYEVFKRRLKTHLYSQVFTWPPSSSRRLRLAAASANLAP